MKTDLSQLISIQQHEARERLKLKLRLVKEFGIPRNVTTSMSKKELEDLIKTKGQLPLL